MTNIGLEYEQLGSVPTSMALHRVYFLLPCASVSFSSTDLEYIWIFFLFPLFTTKRNSYIFLFFINCLSCIHIWVLTSNETRVKILPADLVTQLTGRKLGCEFTLRQWMASAMDILTSGFTI